MVCQLHFHKMHFFRVQKTQDYNLYPFIISFISHQKNLKYRSYTFCAVSSNFSLGNRSNTGQAHMCNLTLSHDTIEFYEKLAIGSPCPEYGQVLTHTLTVTKSLLAFTEGASRGWSDTHLAALQVSGTC